MRDLKKIGKRLQQFMKKNKIGVNELGRLTSTSGAQISHIIRGKKYGIDKFLNILDAFPQLNPYWLIHGEGEMEFEEIQKKGTNMGEVLKNLSEYEEKSKRLEDENEKLKVLNEKLTHAVEYQNLTIEAYKKTIEVQTASINDLKEMVALARSNGQHQEKNKIA